MFATIKEADGPITLATRLCEALAELMRNERAPVPLDCLAMLEAIQQATEGAKQHMWIYESIAVRLEWREHLTGWTIALSSERLTTHGRPPKSFLKKSMLPRLTKLRVSA